MDCYHAGGSKLGDRRLFDELQATGICDGPELRVRAESNEDRPNMVPDGGFNDAELIRDDLGRDAIGQQLKDFLLPRRQQS
jgi:hypothetical protein